MFSLFYSCVSLSLQPLFRSIHVRHREDFLYHFRRHPTWSVSFQPPSPHSHCCVIVSQSSSPPCSLILTIGNILDTIQPPVTQSFRRKSNIFVEGEVYLKFCIPFCVETLYLGFVYFEVCSQKMGKHLG